jgi:hypothetical protein
VRNEKEIRNKVDHHTSTHACSFDRCTKLPLFSSPSCNLLASLAKYPMMLCVLEDRVESDKGRSMVKTHVHALEIPIPTQKQRTKESAHAQDTCILG